jgi:serine protease Do
MKKNALWQIIAVSIGLFVSASSSVFADTTDPVPNVVAQPAISVVGKNMTKTIQFKTLRTTIVSGANVGSLKRGLFCSGGGVIHFEKNYSDAINRIIARSVFKAFDDAGYHRYEGSGSAFETTDVQGADLLLGATVKEHRLSLCSSSGTQATGGVYYKIFWEIFSPSQQKVIFSKTTEGSFNTESALPDNEIHGKAATNAINNLLADPDFVAAYRGDNLPPAATAAPVSLGGGFVNLENTLPPSGGTAKNIAALENAVVTVEATGSLGSGFYIDKSGYLLTDYHVVKDTKYVKVKFRSGEKIVGEVVRVNAARDVALIKTDPIDFAPLSIRFTPGQAGEDVYAIGSPMGLSNSLSKGIVSSLRRLKEQNYVQSDVGITHGSSGGPLLDANGAVLGMSDLTVTVTGDNLNLFIPITEALTTLSVHFRGHDDSGVTAPALVPAPAPARNNVSSAPTTSVDTQVAPAVRVQAAPQVNQANLDSGAQARQKTASVKLGRSSMAVEKMAKDQGCFSDAGAALITDEGPSEIYKVSCTDGKTFVAKCEMRQCTAM